ncbi:DUF58 domain-containing protein [Thermococcus sp. MV11]|uniref:DUF58 domain-containing protein n=1 Tax=Thermococcus sp. MV11 TaxID=1638267 RepID=UPI001431FD6F|nr:DUF58 domain-containing protein [Thermococcus sp. MV11]NJE04488.1 DUF58 domain-containing protein [Thermococcus sp. MV11]
MERLTWLVLLTLAPFSLAILTGVVGLAYASFIPASVLVYGILSEPPSGIVVERDVGSRKLAVGGTAEVRVRLVVEGGSGFVFIGDVTSPGLEVVGKNRHVFFKKPGKRLVVEYSYKIHPLKKGSHSLSPVEVIGRDFLGIKDGTYVLAGEEVEIEAYPRVGGIRRLILSKLRTRERRASNHVAPLGPTSTDFREIREYRPGDSLRTINWKATARLGKVLVNEYEPEGRATVMVYLDTTESTAVGSAFHGSLESSLGLVMSLVSLLLRNDFKVGLYLVGSRRIITPRSGVQAVSTFARAVLSAGPSVHHEESLPLAVERSRTSVRGGVAVAVLVTNLTPYNLDDVKNAIERLRTAFDCRVVVVDVNPYGQFGDVPLALSALHKEGLSEGLKASVVHWNPLGEDVGVAVKKVVGGVFSAL